MSFFKLTPLRILFFIIFAVGLLFILSYLPIFPCKVWAVYPNPVPHESLCTAPIPYFFFAGEGRSYPVGSYILFYFLLLIIPYLLACLIGHLTKR